MVSTIRQFIGSCILAGSLFAQLAFAQSREICLYTDSNGVVHQVNSRADIPAQYSAVASCIKPRESRQPATSIQQSNYLAKPQEIELKGTVRVEDMNSSVGRIRLRWPRKVETLFGRTPQRAMAEAARTASRALKTGSFPTVLQNLHLEWQVVFMDEDVPETQIPAYLVSNCHPAWMTPPANLYLVAQRVAAGCGTRSQKVATSVADPELIHILLHEMGHAIEYRLLQGGNSADRMRAEGFASWFEQYASDFSALIPRDSVRQRYKALAKQAIRVNPNSFDFSGSAYDYGRASMYFEAIVERRGVSGLMQVYAAMAKSAGASSFFAAVKSVLGWDLSRLTQEVKKVVEG